MDSAAIIDIAFSATRAIVNFLEIETRQAFDVVSGATSEYDPEVEVSELGKVRIHDIIEEHLKPWQTQASSSPQASPSASSEPSTEAQDEAAELSARLTMMQEMVDTLTAQNEALADANRRAVETYEIHLKFWREQRDAEHRDKLKLMAEQADPQQAIDKYEDDVAYWKRRYEVAEGDKQKLMHDLAHANHAAKEWQKLAMAHEKQIALTEAELSEQRKYHEHYKQLWQEAKLKAETHAAHALKRMQTINELGHNQRQITGLWENGLEERAKLMEERAEQERKITALEGQLRLKEQTIEGLQQRAEQVLGLQVELDDQAKRAHALVAENLELKKLPDQMRDEIAYWKRIVGEHQTSLELQTEELQKLRAERDQLRADIDQIVGPEEQEDHDEIPEIEDLRHMVELLNNVILRQAITAHLSDDEASVMNRLNERLER